MGENKEVTKENLQNSIIHYFVLFYSSLICPLTLIFYDKNTTIAQFENGIEIMFLMILLIKLKQSGHLDLEEFIQFMIIIFYFYKIIGSIYIVDSLKSDSLSLLCWLRLIRSPILIRKLVGKSCSINQSVFIYIVNIIIVLNNLTCIWIGIGQVRMYSKNWISYYNFDKVSEFDLYIASLYYNVNTILTIGYGDIRSTNIIEIIYNIILLLSLVITLPFIISKLYNVISISNAVLKEDMKTEEKLNFFNSLSKKYGISSSFYDQIKNYLILKKKSNNEFTKILENLPYNYKKSLVEYVYLKEGINLQKNKFLKNKSKDFLLNFLPIIEVSRFSGNLIIGSIGNMYEEIYIVLNGELTVVSQQGVEILSVRENRYVGINYKKGNIPFDVKVKESAKVIILRKLSRELLNLNHSKEMKEISVYCDSLYEYLIEAHKLVNRIILKHGMNQLEDTIKRLNFKLSGEEAKFQKALKNILLNYGKDDVIKELNSIRKEQTTNNNKREKT
jgi:hypothetical protein